jgi:hypothetical protein
MDTWGFKGINMVKIRTLIIRMPIMYLVRTTGHHRRGRGDSLALDLQVQVWMVRVVGMDPRMVRGEEVTARYHRKMVKEEVDMVHLHHKIPMLKTVAL